MVEILPPKHGPLHRNEYRCDACGEFYQFARTHEECLAEEAENFGGPLRDDDRAIVCHGCYIEFMSAYDEAGRPEVPR